MEEYSEEQLEGIVQGFVEKTLDKSLWTHYAHIIAAIWHLMKFDKEDALCRMKSGIISYNLATGGQNTGQNGYHETMTVFWWEVLHQFLDNNPGHTFPNACAIFLKSPMSDKNYPFEFYSKELIFSPAARARYVAADLKEVKVEC